MNVVDLGGDVFNPIRGQLSIYRMDGVQATLVHEGANQIVTTARRIMAKLVAGGVPDSAAVPATIAQTNPLSPLYPSFSVDSINSLVVAKMRWGTSDQATSADDEYLVSSLTVERPVTIMYMDEFTTRFDTTLERGDLNGETLNEVVLLTHAGLTFARKVFPSIEKAYAYSYLFRWIITF